MYTSLNRFVCGHSHPSAHLPACVCLFFYIKEAQHHVSMWLRMTNLLSLSTAMQLSTVWPGPCFPAFLTHRQKRPACETTPAPQMEFSFSRGTAAWHNALCLRNYFFSACVVLWDGHGWLALGETDGGCWLA